MTRTNLSDGELAALAARIQRNYDYEARSDRFVAFYHLILLGRRYK